MTCFLYCINDLVSLFSFYLILRYIFKEIPYMGKWRMIFCAVLSTAISVTGYLLLPGKTEYAFDMLDFAATVIALISVLLLFRKPRFWRSFAVLFIYYATIDTLWSFIASFFDVGIVQESIFSLIVTIAVSVAVLKGSNHKDLNVVAGAFREIPVWLLISLFLFELTNYYQEFGTSDLAYKILYVTSSCLIFLSILYLVFRVFRLVYTQNSILRQLNEQLIQADEQKKSDESLRQFRHDIKNHAVIINSLLEQGDYEGAKSYFSSLSPDMASNVQRFSTGNSVVDSLLNIKAAAARRQDTEITFNGAVPDKGIEPKDICVCFGNLLDNALEACALLPDEISRAIDIKSVIQNNLWILTFENPTKSAGKIGDNGLPATTKKNIKLHGIGLKNVRDTGKKYNGTLHLSVDRGRFTAEMLFELTEI